MSAGAWQLRSTPLRGESDITLSRMRARMLAGLLGFSDQDRTRLAAATSEVARHVIQQGGGTIDFRLEDTTPQCFWIGFSASAERPGDDDDDPRWELEVLGSARALLDQVRTETHGGRRRVQLGRTLPAHAPRLEREPLLRQVHEQLRALPSTTPAAELAQQNRELLDALKALRDQSEVLAQANLELEETNRGVVALHAELDARASLLSQTSELKSRLLSLVSHEFRTPLGSIRMLSDLLLTDATPALAEPHRAQVELIQQTAAELAELVDDLLDLSKAQAGKLQVQPSHFRPEQLFSALRVLLRPLARGTEVNLDLERVDDLPDMFSDAPKISLILRNLISNALKFTVRGEVRVKASLDGPECICFQVIDTGVGIAPEDQPRLFQDFSQIENPLQSGLKGTGLGLALVRRFTELLGGSVSVQSAPDEGSTFTVRLPRRWTTEIPDPIWPPELGGAWQEEATRPPVSAPRMNPKLEPAARTRPAHGPRRVLVVDDDPAARHLLVHHLERLGCETLEARDGAEGLWLARKELPELLFLDLEMPALSGWEVVPQLRNETRTREIPVVIVTGRARSAVERVGLDVQGLVIKRDDASQLQRELSGLLERLAPRPAGGAPHV